MLGSLQQLQFKTYYEINKGFIMKKLFLGLAILASSSSFASYEVLLEQDIKFGNSSCQEYQTEFHNTMVDVKSFLNQALSSASHYSLNKSLGVSAFIDQRVGKIDYLSMGNDRIGVMLYKCVKADESKNNESKIILSEKMKLRNSHCSSVETRYYESSIDADEFARDSFTFLNPSSTSDSALRSGYNKNTLSTTYLRTKDNNTGALFTYCSDANQDSNILDDVQVGINDNSDRMEAQLKEREFQERLLREIAKKRLNREVVYSVRSSKRMESSRQCRSRWVFLGEGSIFKRVKKNCDSITVVGDGAVLRVIKN